MGRGSTDAVAEEMGDYQHKYEPLRSRCTGRKQRVWEMDLGKFYYPCSKQRKHLENTRVKLEEDSG